MENFYSQKKEEIVSKLTSEELKNELLKEIESAILELNVAEENYNTATSGLVDYYSYKIKAAQSRVDFLIKTIKDMKLNKIKIV